MTAATARAWSEARDLVEDRARPCDLCKRRMRFFPVAGAVVVRCPGRGYGWRCHDCMAGGLRVASLLTGQGMLPRDWLQHWHGLATETLAQYRDIARAHARDRSPLLAEALDRLCMQLQWIGLPLADCADAVALGNVLHFPPSLRPSLPAAAAPL